MLPRRQIKERHLAGRPLSDERKQQYEPRRVPPELRVVGWKPPAQPVCALQAEVDRCQTTSQRRTPSTPVQSESLVRDSRSTARAIHGQLKRSQTPRWGTP